ncbi:MAG: universal stress protein [Chloroflexota bacterium]|nr:universal stress protein [Chloroflexota bacterium]MDE2941111.1 universal stress protein [Chloroflexota bacterium]MDE3267363.1 universal stress protein [Chloroflexota bacterium]
MKILVTLDGSTFSEAIVPAAAQLAQATGSEVHLLSVVEDPGIRRSWVEAIAMGEAGTGEFMLPPGSMPRYPDARRGASMSTETLEDALHSARQYLAEMALRFPAGAKTSAVPGNDPVAAITEYAAENGIELIAMSTHGRSGIGRWVYGSNADKLLQSTTIPMLLVRPRSVDASEQGATPIDTLVVPLDGSSLAEEALAYAEGIASQMSAKLSLIRVVTTPGIAYPGVEAYVYNPGAFTDLEKEAATYLQEKQAHLESQGIEVSCTVKAGYAANYIIDLAEDSESNLIVMSTHGRGGVGRWVMGSVADRVLRASYRPILLIRSG